jgi:hypothetical protein
VVFQVAVKRSAGLDIDETLTPALHGVPVPVREVVGVTGSRLHIAEPGVGNLQLFYQATFSGRA